jgi:predicted small integral membrane protein
VNDGSNYAFVEHVLTMDTTFEGNQLKSSAIGSTFLHNLFYWLIIASEGLVSLLCLFGRNQYA